MESVKAFVELLRSDPLLMDKVTSIPPSDIDSVVKLASEHGFSFTPDQYKAYLNDLTPNSSELNDEDLSLLSGGVGTQSPAGAYAGAFSGAVVGTGNLDASVSAASSGSGW